MSELGGIRYPDGFVENHAKMGGNTQSGHGVVFGRFENRDVAIKPFVRQKGEGSVNMKKAEHEARMYQKASRLGFQTLRPIRAVQGDGTTAFLISEFRPRLVPVSGLDLRPSGSGEQSVVLDVASVIGSMHAERMTHGDAKPRNFSIDRLYPGEIVVTDLESAQFHGKINSRSDEFFDGSKKRDVSSFAETVARNGYGNGVSYTELEDLFMDTLIAPYSKEVDKVSQATIQNALESFMRGNVGFATEDYKYL